MKVYRGSPGQPVTVEDGGKVTVLDSRATLAWGDGGQGSANLAKALARDATGDDALAVRVHQRLKHRTVMVWSKEAQWSITDRDLMAHIDDIRDVEKDTAHSRAMVNQQPAPIVYEGGPGVAGIPIKRSDKDQGPGPEVPPQHRPVAASAPAVATATAPAQPPAASQRPTAGRGEAMDLDDLISATDRLSTGTLHIASPVPDDWPEKVDGFRVTTGDLLASTRLCYCLVLCGCYSWQDAAIVPEGRLRAIPEWGNALMAEMLEWMRKRGVTYAAKDKRQAALQSALAKLSQDEKEALGL